MANKARLERKLLWLWLVWTILPVLAALAIRRFGDYSLSALWRWGFLLLWTLIAPTIVAFRHASRVRALERENPHLPHATIGQLLQPGSADSSRQSSRRSP